MEMSPSSIRSTTMTMPSAANLASRRDSSA
jgi:hypothetical protein